LLDEEVQKTIDSVTGELTKSFGASLR